jgi:hypothetical protein
MVPRLKPSADGVMIYLDVAGRLRVRVTAITHQNVAIEGDDDTAVSTVLRYLEGTFYDQPFAGRYRYIRFWKIIDQQWKIVGGSVCAVPLSPPQPGYI